MKTLLLLCLVTRSALATVPNLSILPGASPAGIATDSQGNIYVAGSPQPASSPWQPAYIGETFVVECTLFASTARHLCRRKAPGRYTRLHF